MMGQITAESIVAMAKQIQVGAWNEVGANFTSFRKWQREVRPVLIDKVGAILRIALAGNPDKLSEVSSAIAEAKAAEVKALEDAKAEKTKAE